MPVNSHDVTDEQWEGLAQVVPLRGRDAWPSAVDHRARPDAETEARRRFVVLRVNRGSMWTTFAPRALASMSF
jgi:hypothetical protein